MKRHLLTLNFLIIVSGTCFSQSAAINNSNIFLNGVQLEKPNYNFLWNFQIANIPQDKFLNLAINKKGNSVWTHINFDSVILTGQFLLGSVIVKAVKKKYEDKFEMKEFTGTVDFQTLKKMESFFNYKWKGWTSYPTEKPFYKFKLHRIKDGGAILISRI